jgi:hypothetical protein
MKRIALITLVAALALPASAAARTHHCPTGPYSHDPVTHVGIGPLTATNTSCGLARRVADATAQAIARRQFESIPDYVYTATTSWDVLSARALNYAQARRTGYEDPYLRVTLVRDYGRGRITLGLHT